MGESEIARILEAIGELKGIVNNLVSADKRSDKAHEDFEARLRILEGSNSKFSGVITVIAVIISAFGAVILSHYIDNAPTKTVIQQTQPPATVTITPTPSNSPAAAPSTTNKKKQNHPLPISVANIQPHQSRSNTSSNGGRNISPKTATVKPRATPKIALKPNGKPLRPGKSGQAPGHNKGKK